MSVQHMTQERMEKYVSTVSPAETQNTELM